MTNQPDLPPANSARPALALCFEARTQATEAIPAAKGARLLYAAQVARDALQTPPARQKTTAE